MNRYWNHLVTSTEKRVERFLKMQVMDTQSREYGRLRSDVVEGKETIYILADAVSLYFLSDSKFYKSSELLQRISAGLSFVERWQRPDGSLDFPTCNFFSAPDTAFCFRRLYGAYGILKQYGDNEKSAELASRYLAVMLKCLPIIMYGGFHTPNHRWAVTSVLSCIQILAGQYPDIALNIPAFETPFTNIEDLQDAIQSRIDEYLAEGIDGDKDGEYAERSTGGYNAVVDKCLITMYECTNNPEYLGFVERNLEMMLYYIEPNDTIFTQNSTRQDNGKLLYLDGYFPLYAFMAAETGNPLFGKAAHKIIKDNMERGDLAPDCLHLFMLNPKMQNYSFKDYGYLDSYRKFFPGSQVLRFRNENYSYSVLGNNSHFLFVHFNKMPIAVRIGTSYCDVRSFISQDMEVTPDGCKLSATVNGWYYEPFENPPETSDWWAMDHTKRKKINTSSLKTVVTIKELEKGLDISVKTEGLDGLPLRTEVRIPKDTIVENDTFYTTAEKGGQLVLKQGDLSVTDETETVVISSGSSDSYHTFKGHYSGEDRHTEGYTVFLNDYTPSERHFTITLK